MSCRPPCGARRCRRPIARTPPSCLAGPDALAMAKYDAGFAYARLTEVGVGHEASISTQVWSLWYLQHTSADGIGSQALVLAAVSISYAHFGASYRIISHQMQSIHHISYRMRPTQLLTSVPRFSDRCVQATQGAMPNSPHLSDHYMHQYPMRPLSTST